MVVTRGAPERGRSSAVPVTLTRSTNIEIVYLETLHCTATTVRETPQAKTPKSRSLSANVSLGILIKELNLLYSK